MHNAWTADSKICIIGPSCASKIVVSVSWRPHWCPGFTNILSPKSPTMRTERTHKLRDKPKPYVSKPGPKTPWKAPATSAISTKDRQRKNLTVNDWLTVFAFVDAHPGISQASVCNHFHSLADGALEFNQATLSRKLKMREDLEAYATSFPNAVSTKREHIVVCPDVDRALYLWVKSMESKGEIVTGGMLCTKRSFFERELGVPEDAQLKGGGWLASFKKVYEVQVVD